MCGNARICQHKLETVRAARWFASHAPSATTLALLNTLPCGRGALADAMLPAAAPTLATATRDWLQVISDRVMPANQPGLFQPIHSQVMHKLTHRPRKVRNVKSARGGGGEGTVREPQLKRPRARPFVEGALVQVRPHH